jgi:hypothetical protein
MQLPEEDIKYPEIHLDRRHLAQTFLINGYN